MFKEVFMERLFIKIEPEVVTFTLRDARTDEIITSTAVSYSEDPDTVIGAACAAVTLTDEQKVFARKFLRKNAGYRKAAKKHLLDMWWDLV
jgi:hypothetical protein